MNDTSLGTGIAGQRRYDIDALRIMAFGLLILYHLGMAYVADWDFHVKSRHLWEWLQWPMVGVNRWRMGLIFLISGIALGLARPARSPLGFAGRRTHRLLLPLAFGMLAIVPIQAYCEAVVNGSIQPGFMTFMARYLQLRPWPEAEFAGAAYGVTWNHLWYLAYLWAYTVILLCLLPLGRTRLGRWATNSRLWPSHWRGPVLLFVPILYLFAALHWVEPLYPTTHALTDDWYTHIEYLPLLLFGYAVARDEGFWASLVQNRWKAFAVAVFGFGVYMGLRILGKTLSPGVIQNLPDINWRAISDASHVIYQWGALLTILAFGRRWLNRPFRWLPYGNTAVYPWYILHQSLIIPLVFWLRPIGLPGWLEFTLVLGGTILGCAVIHELLVRRIRILRPLFGLKTERPDAAIRNTQSSTS